MEDYHVRRSQLKKACDTEKWDLLDKLLEIDSSLINDKSLYTDGWGEWWGLLLECVFRDHLTGVRILLKHGADKNISSWGDGMAISAIEVAKENQEIRDLLEGTVTAEYVRASEPSLPVGEDCKDQAVNGQGEVRDETGLVFPWENFE